MYSSSITSLILQHIEAGKHGRCNALFNHKLMLDLAHPLGQQGAEQTLASEHPAHTSYARLAALSSG
jgi:hypothetical protein